MQKSLIIYFLLLLLILGAIFLGWPKYQDLNQLRLEVKAKEKELQNKEDYFSELRNLALKLKEYASELAIVDTALPADPSACGFLNFLEKASSQNGLIVKNLSLGEISSFEEESDIKRIAVSFSATGPYSALKNFLSVLQNSSRLIEVKSIYFSSPEKGEVFSFDLIIRTHSY